MTEPEATLKLQMQLPLARGIHVSLEKKNKLKKDSLFVFVRFLSRGEQHKTCPVLGDMEDPP